MDLSELTKKMNQLVKSKGWYEHDSPRPQLPRNLAISLSLESSEVLEHFQWGEEIRDRQALASELADVSLYLLQLADVCGIDLENAILEKIEVNHQRTWDSPKDESK
jgi:NTP pyrophosphatase (non-canonical NTP hydrolase)